MLSNDLPHMRRYALYWEDTTRKLDFLRMYILHYNTLRPRYYYHVQTFNGVDASLVNKQQYSAKLTPMADCQPPAGEELGVICVHAQNPNSNVTIGPLDGVYYSIWLALPGFSNALAAELHCTERGGHFAKLLNKVHSDKIVASLMLVLPSLMGKFLNTCA